MLEKVSSSSKSRYERLAAGVITIISSITNTVRRIPPTLQEARSIVNLPDLTVVDRPSAMGNGLDRKAAAPRHPGLERIAGSARLAGAVGSLAVVCVAEVGSALAEWSTELVTDVRGAWQRESGRPLTEHQAQIEAVGARSLHEVLAARFQD